MVVLLSTAPSQDGLSGLDWISIWSESEVQFAFVLEPGYTMYAFSSTVEVLRLVGKFGSEAEPSWYFASIGNLSVPTSKGISVQITRDIGDLLRRAIVVVVSGTGVHGCKNSKLLAKMRSWNRQGHRIWAISSGVVRLAQAGLVNDTTVTVHWEDIHYLTDNHSHVTVSTSLFIGHCKHLTCTGGGSVVDLMLEFIERELSPELVEDIVSLLVTDEVRDGWLSQSRPMQMRYATENETVLATIQAKKYTPIAVAIGEIARHAGKPQRQLERLFDLEFGKTPCQVYRELRHGAARQSIIAGRRPLNEVAWDFGFERTQLTQVYRRNYGFLPSTDCQVRNSSASQSFLRNGAKSDSCISAR